MQCTSWAGDGSHRTPMMTKANQTPAIDSVRIDITDERPGRGARRGPGAACSRTRPRRTRRSRRRPPARSRTSTATAPETRRPWTAPPRPAPAPAPAANDGGAAAAVPADTAAPDSTKSLQERFREEQAKQEAAGN